MAEKRDYYDVLGLKRDASTDDIKAAYKRLAKEYHPDVSKDPKAKEKFQEVLEAYTVLSDSQKRQNYDQFGHSAEGFSGFDFSGFGRGMDFDFSELFENFGGFGDFGPFAEMFGSRKTKRPRNGENLRADVWLSFEEAAFGTKKQVEIERLESCDACNGSGSEKGGRETCPQCKGRGITQNTQRTPFGMFSVQTTCSKCKGEGTAIKHPCKTCNGKGVLKKRKKITVSIPEGIDTGMHLKLEGEGNASATGGKPGDLFVVIFVEKDESFKRDGPDLFVEIPLSFAQAALGAELEIPILKGKAKLKVPSGTQTGTIFRLRDKGVFDLKSGRKGDEFVKVRIVTPSKLSKKERELFERIAAENSEKTSKKWF